MKGSDIFPPLADMLAHNAACAEQSCEHTLHICFLRNFTIEGIEPFLSYHCLGNSIRPIIFFGGYDTVLQDLIKPNLQQDQPEIIVLALIIEQLDPAYGEPGWMSNVALERLFAIFRAAAENTRSLLVVNTFIPPYDSDSGITTSKEIVERTYEVATINRAIRDFVFQNNRRFFLVDWERITRICGEQNSMDYRFWYMSKAPFKQSFLNLYALEVFKIVRALKGKIKKCLLLDCDNTLWGGVVGEDGISGISLDRHSYPGNVYYDFHKQILRLHDRGVLIALVSKNNEEDVWEILERHSDCLIKRKHLSAWRVNWNDKAENIRSIAAELNLGIDSFVFVDDSPVECDLVRGLLPDVSVIQVPSKLYLLPGVLARDGLFDTLVLSAEDRIRSAMYQAETLRKQAEGTFTTLEEYLTTLGLEATIHLARLDDLARIAQLTQKTNQFNLTTRRYSVAQIEAFHHSSNAAVFSLNVSDRFGDSGLTGVLIALREGTVGKIDTFLLSCRVLGRNLETVFLDRCLVMLQKCWGVSKWFAEYIPSPKNGQTADFYSRVGFTVIQEDSAVKVYQSNSDQRQSLEISYISVKEGNDGLS